MTKGVRTRDLSFIRGFCHRVFSYIDALRGPCLKALTLLSPLSPSPEGKGWLLRWGVVLMGPPVKSSGKGNANHVVSLVTEFL